MKPASTLNARFVRAFFYPSRRSHIDPNVTAASVPFRARACFDAAIAAWETGMNIQGKRAIVTGSNSGIGLGIARALAQAGAEVVLNSFTDRP